jgi:protein arginine kinase
MKVDDLLYHTSEWLKGIGPYSDIVISSRVRLARNLQGRFFPHWANNNKEQAEETTNIITEAAQKVDYLKKTSFFKLSDLNSIDKQFLVERHLMSREHASKADSKAVVVDEEEIVSIMINEEDHLRMQVMKSGFDLLESWEIMNVIDDALSRELRFAFDAEFGYLTACPTNVGTGMRGSVMLHLPALVMMRTIDKVLAAIAKLSFTTRGLYGEGTQATGNFFQISNQVSLGHNEDEIITNINGIIRQIIEHEEQARGILLKQQKELLEDRIWRAYGVLKNAYIISSSETTELLSMVRLGVDLNIVKNLDRRTVNQLFLLIQPAHLQKLEGKKLNSQERDIKRANILRSKLTL